MNQASVQTLEAAAEILHLSGYHHAARQIQAALDHAHMIHNPLTGAQK